MYWYNWFIGHIEHSVWVVHFLFDLQYYQYDMISIQFFLAKLGRKKFLSGLRNYFSNRRVEEFSSSWLRERSNPGSSQLWHRTKRKELFSTQLGIGAQWWED
jgi:hypothetical protein